MRFVLQYKNRLIQAGIIFLAVFLRFYGLKTLPPGLYPDEAMNGNNVSQALATGHFEVFYPENNGREGLFMLLEAPFVTLFGHYAWALRATSAVIGSLTVLGIYLMLSSLAEVCKLSNYQAIGLVGSFFLATSTWHLIFSREGFRAILAPFLLIFAIWLLLRALQKERLWLILLAGVVMGLGYYSYTAFRIMPLVLLALLPLFLKTKKRIRLTIVYVISAVVTTVPLINYFLQHPEQAWGHADQLSVFNYPHPLATFLNNIWLSVTMLFIKGDMNWRQNISGMPELSLPLGICLVAGVIVVVFRNLLFDRLLFFWLLLGAVPMAVSNQALPHALRSILMLPAAIGLAASGAVWIYEYFLSSVTRWARNLTVITLGIVLLINVWLAYFITYASAPGINYAFAEQYTLLAKKINALPESETKYVVLTQGDLSLCYPTICVQSVMFLTNTYLPKQQQEKHIRYLTPFEFEQMGSSVKNVYFLN